MTKDLFVIIFRFTISLSWWHATNIWLQEFKKTCGSFSRLLRNYFHLNHHSNCKLSSRQGIISFVKPWQRDGIDNHECGLYLSSVSDFRCCLLFFGFRSFSSKIWGFVLFSSIWGNRDNVKAFYDDCLMQLIGCTICFR